MLAHEISHVTQHHIARMIAGQQRFAADVARRRWRSRSSRRAPAAARRATRPAARSPPRRRWRSRTSSTSRARTNTRPTASASSASTPPASTTRAMATFMERLQRSTRFADSSAPSYLRTHPVTYERIAEAQARAYGRPYRQVPDSLDFQMVRALLRSYEGEPKDAVAVLRQRARRAQVQQRDRRALRARRVAAARQELRAREDRARDAREDGAAASDDRRDGRPRAARSGDVDGGRSRASRAALARYPNKMQLVYDYPEALMQDGRNADAAAFCERQLARFPDDGPLHLTAARAYAALGKQLMQHQHQGEYYAWQGNLQGAIDQFELALEGGRRRFLPAVRRRHAAARAAPGSGGPAEIRLRSLRLTRRLQTRQCMADRQSRGRPMAARSVKCDDERLAREIAPATARRDCSTRQEFIMHAKPICLPRWFAPRCSERAAATVRANDTVARNTDRMTPPASTRHPRRWRLPRRPIRRRRRRRRWVRARPKRSTTPRSRPR